jgi:glycosyltransferase involved in cell wall biosynthesis
MINDSRPKWRILLFNLDLIAKVFWLDLYHNNDKRDVLKKLRYNLSLLLKLISISDSLKQVIKSDPDKKTYISFWMDDWAICLSILKYRKQIENFVFRVHQHDLYIEMNPEGYIPFRFFNFKMTSAVFPDAARGVKFLKRMDFYSEKVRLGHLGVHDQGINPFEKNSFTLVSCARLVSRKRVEFIADVLMDVKGPVKWIHFGRTGDSPESFNNLKRKCEKLPSNISWDLKGDVVYSELIEFYRSIPVSLFITLTSAEGLPVSIMEAISFGIPVLATDIMGIKDIVTDDTGILISPDERRVKIADILSNFMESKLNTLEFRKGVREFWKASFNAEKNYYEFNKLVDEVSNIKK